MKGRGVSGSLKSGMRGELGPPLGPELREATEGLTWCVFGKGDKVAEAHVCPRTGRL